MRHLVVLPLFLALTACGPVPLVQAEAECRTRADQASAPHGSVAVGISSDGEIATELSIGVTGDYLTGRDPSEVYNSCVYQRSGQMPSRPYITLPPTR
jgi:hypothetical protein